MTVRLSKLFGMDIYTNNAEYRGKVFDLVINLEKGRIETITTEALKARSKQEAKKIISEKSIPYRNVKAAKDIIIVSSVPVPEEEDEPEPVQQTPRMRPTYRFRRWKHLQSSIFLKKLFFLRKFIIFKKNIVLKKFIIDFKLLLIYFISKWIYN